MLKMMIEKTLAGASDSLRLHLENQTIPWLAQCKTS